MVVVVYLSIDCLFCWFPGSGRVAGVLGTGEEQLPHGAEQGEWSHMHMHTFHLIIHIRTVTIML